MRSLPRVLLLVSLVLVPLLPALPASAEEDPPAPPADAPAPKAQADPTIPGYSIEFLMPGADDEIEGWKAQGGPLPAGAPSESGLTELAESCKLDDDTFYVELRTLTKGSDKVAIAMIDVDENVAAFRAKLDEQVTAGGWTVRELGSPARLLVLSGAKAKAAVAPLVEHVVYALGEMAINRVNGPSAHEAAGREAALEYAKSIDNIVPDTGLSHGIEGRVHWLKSLPAKRDEKPDRELQDKALASFKKALAEGAKYPPKGSVLVWIAGTHGSILLERKDKSVLAEAIRAFEMAVEHEVDARMNNQRYGNRYNLTCAYARAGRIEDAFKMLEKSIETGKTLPPAAWAEHFKNMEEKDPDMGPLRSNPRFSKLMADNRPPPPKNPHRRMPPDHPGGDGKGDGDGDGDKDKPKPKDGR